jgi:hypothetical protein
MKKSILVCLAIVPILFACSGSPHSGWQSEPSSTTQADLNAVQSCISQSQTCASGATTASAVATCEQQLKACLGTLVAEAGIPSAPPWTPDDAGPPFGFPFDAGSLPQLPGFDGGLPSLPSFDAGLPSIPFDDAGAFPGSSCIQTLQSCLSGSTNPATCAQQVATCLEKAI